MSNKKITRDRKPEDQGESGRINDDLEQLAKAPIGRTNNALPNTGQAGKAPIGRTRNALPNTGQAGKPPIGRTRNALRHKENPEAHRHDQ